MVKACSLTGVEMMSLYRAQGFTGHPMGVSFEDVAAVEALHRGIIPPTANNPTVDPILVSLAIISSWKGGGTAWQRLRALWTLG